MIFSSKIKDMNTDKGAINWQNYTRVRLQQVCFYNTALMLFGASFASRLP